MTVCDVVFTLDTVAAVWACFGLNSAERNQIRQGVALPDDGFRLSIFHSNAFLNACLTPLKNPAFLNVPAVTPSILYSDLYVVSVCLNRKIPGTWILFVDPFRQQYFTKARSSRKQRNGF